MQINAVDCIWGSAASSPNSRILVQRQKSSENVVTVVVTVTSLGHLREDFHVRCPYSPNNDT
jgi:hypothetical protein